jgi:glycosyltransferase involved in cell wall biosynthesis
LDDTLLTILMPCRNVEPSYFREALDSVRAQTSPRWRLCIVIDAADDGSTAAILSAPGAWRDRRVSVVQATAPRVTGALNAGLRSARTPYVCTLHADDVLEERAIEVLERAIREHPAVDYFHSSRIYIDDDGRQIGALQAREHFSLEDFKHFGPVMHLHCFKVDSALAVGGMDEALGPHAADDYDFPWCLAEAGFTFMAIPDFLYRYRDHRRHERLTTHVPLDVQVAEYVKIWTKHGMTEAEIAEQIHRRTSGYLRQALFLNEDDRRDKERHGFDIRTGWREMPLPSPSQ